MDVGMDVDGDQFFDVEAQWLTFEGCDMRSGPWRSYLLLLCPNASLHDHEVMFPNELHHGARTLYDATPWAALQFLSDPSVSEVGSMWRG
jgi:hypothetical protein